MEILTVIFDSVADAERIISYFLPRFLLAVVVLILGWVMAKLLRMLTLKVLRLTRLEVAAEKSGIDSFLVRGNVRYTLTTLVAEGIYWSIIFFAVLSALNILGFETATDLFKKAIFYIPNVFAAILAIIFGSIVAKLTQSSLAAYLNNLGLESADALSSMARYVILIFVTFIALEQLSIGGEIITSAFKIIFGSICFSTALAFGLGGKNLAEKILDRVWKL